MQTGTRGTVAIKVIVVMGVLTFALLWAASLGLKKSLLQGGSQRVVIREKYSPFVAQRAWNDLEHIVGIGPRPPASEGAEATRAYLRDELERAGVQLREQSFEANTPEGPKQMVNLTAVIPGTRDEVVLLGSHYDTKHLPGIAFVGANNGGATTAWMLEMARVLGPAREGFTLWLAWFDGEEAFAEWSDEDGIYGSRAYVAHLRQTGDFERVRAMINLNRIGDCHLGIFRDRDAPTWLSEIVWETASRIGYGRHFSDLGQQSNDARLPFREAGIPALELIDFMYGSSPLAHQRTWHTSEDTLDKVCRESLQAVADVIYHSLPALEAALDAEGTL